jgi:hypothetical protein
MPGRAVAIAFGRVLDPAAALAAEGRELESLGRTIGVQTAVLRPGAPTLALNAPGWFQPDADLLRAVMDGPSLRTAVRRRLLALVPSHRAAAAAFVGRYLDEAEAIAGPAPSADEARETIRHPGDAFFDAPLPLPNAWLPAGDGGFVRVDAAFWIDGALRPVILGGRETVSPAARRQLDAAPYADAILWLSVGRWSQAEGRRCPVRAMIADAMMRGSGHGPVRSPAFAEAAVRVG